MSKRDARDAASGHPQPLGDLAKASLKKMAGPQRGALLDVLAVWREAVGPRVAGVARPRRLADSVLTLEVPSPVWSQQLVLMAPELINALNAKLGSEMVRELRFSPSRGTRPAPH